MVGMEGFTMDARYDKGQVVSLTDPSLHQTVRYKGIFDIHEVYKIIYDWLSSRGYQVHEHKYKSIAQQAGRRERSFDWNAHRKVTEFVMYWIYIHFQFQDIVDIDVIKDGKQKKLQKGRVLIRVQHAIEYDFAERAAYNKLQRSMINFLTTIMWKKKIDTLWEDKLRFKCYELVNIIKEALDFMTKGNEHYDVW